MSPYLSQPRKNKDPLHGMTLSNIVSQLVDEYGWDELAVELKLNCFKSNPSLKSSLTFLRKTPWAREKVESFYINSLKKSK